MSNALDEALRSAVAGLRPVKRSGTAATAGIRPGSALSVDATLKLFDAQATSRHLDFAARMFGVSDSAYHALGTEATLRALEGSGIRCASVDQGLVKTYLQRFVDTGRLHPASLQVAVG